MLGVAIDPWRPADSVAVLKLLSAVSSSTFLTELTRARLLLALGRKRAADLLPGGAPLRLAGGSNLWAVTAARSGRSAPLLAADPHLPLLSPGVWYMARLQFSDGGVIGATLPGAPVVLAGRNSRIAWGFAALAADTGDFYIEKPDPKDPRRYKTPDGWASFERRKVVIGQRDGRGWRLSSSKRATGRLFRSIGQKSPASRRLGMSPLCAGRRWRMTTPALRPR